MKIVFLGIGTNLGRRESNLKEAISRIEKNIGLVSESSSVYETEPWGFQTRNQFLNMVVKVETKLIPSELLDRILEIESLMGRKKGEKQYSSRVIDIDILLYDELVINEKRLKIPHPRMHERRFIMIPLCEIEPEMVHPVLNKSIGELLEICEDTSEVKKYFCPPPDSYRDPLKGGQ